MSLIYFGPPFSGPAFSVNPVRPHQRKRRYARKIWPLASRLSWSL